MIRGVLSTLSCIVVFGCSSPTPPDLQAYIDEVRAAGITENAERSLAEVAGIKTGRRILKFQRGGNSGRYGRAFISGVCAAPGTDPVDWKAPMAEAEAKVQAEIAVLKPVADRDHSGFVSTAEGDELRTAMEFGIQAAFINQDVEHERSRMLEALQMSEEDFQRTAQLYSSYLDQLPDYQGAPFPTLTFVQPDATLP